MQVSDLSQKVALVRINDGLASSEELEIGDLSGSIASVARIAHKGRLTNITLYTNQGCIARMLATLDCDLRAEVVNGVYRNIEKVTCLKTSETQPITGRQIEVQFTQPEIQSNVFGGKITDEQIPEDAKGVVKFFRSHSLPVILLILNREGCATKISTPFSHEEILSEPYELEAFARAESSIRANIEEKTGYHIREVYTKSANPGVPFPTANFVLDKIKK